MSPLLRHHANMPQVVRESVCAGQGGRLTEVRVYLAPSLHRNEGGRERGPD